MNDIERDLRRRLKKSIRKRTELNNRVLGYQKEKQKLIEYLKEKISILDNILENEKDEDKIYNCLIRRTTFKEILNKIEKR